MSDPRFTVHTFPVIDTGIGVEAGYASDQSFREAMEAKRAAMPPEIRAELDRLNAEFERRFVGR